MPVFSNCYVRRSNGGSFQRSFADVPAFRSRRAAPSFLLALPLLLALVPAPVSAQTAGIELDQSSITLYERETDFVYHVRLATQPSGSVTVRATSSFPSRINFDPNLSNTDASGLRFDLTFTASNWNQWQRVEGGRLLSFDEDSGTATISHTATSSADSNYNNLSGPNLSLTASASENPVDRVLLFTPASLRINEDASATYTVRFRSDPGNNTTRVVAISTGGSSKATVSTNSLTFTGGSSGNWDTEQTVRVEPVGDPDSSNESLVISHNIGATPVGRLPVTIVDNLSGALRFTPSQVTVFMDVDSIYSIQMLSRPSSSVTVTGTPSDVRDVSFATTGSTVNLQDQGMFTHTFTTTNWNVPVKVALTYGRDSSATINHALTSADSQYNGLSESLPVTVEVASEPRAVLSVSPTSLSEGSNVTVTVNLAAGWRAPVAPGRTQDVPSDHRRKRQAGAEYRGGCRRSGSGR